MNRDRWALRIKLYIPLWLYSNVASCRGITQVSALYIPFWLYSNNIGQAVDLVKDYFTFHSGYIPMASDTPIISHKLPLHSILVIFQWSNAHKWRRNRQALHSILVIFQSNCVILFNIPNVLYIPFWLYSNWNVEIW